MLSGPTNGLGSDSVEGRPCASPATPEERSVGADERLADRLDRGTLAGVRGGGVRPVVLVREVQDALGLGGPAADGVEVVEVAPENGDALRLERCGGGVGACEAGDGVAGGEEVVDGVGADPAGGSGDEHVHVSSLHRCPRR